MSNPYDPQTPARPEYFGGRKQVLTVVRERIEAAAIRKKSGGVLVYGHRGVGKTSLLQKIIDETRGTEDCPSNTLVFYRRLAKTTSDNELYSILNEEVRTQVERRKSMIQRLTDAAKTVTAVKAFEIGFDLNRREETGSSQYQLWKLLVGSLRHVDFVLVAIDDADFLSVEAMSELKTIAEDTQDIPIVLMISGGVGFEEKLVDNYSPVARIFSGANFNIGRFTREETAEVLKKPLADQRVRWTEKGIDKLHKLTAGYPYLVQCLAKASYTNEGEIDDQRVDSSVRASLEIGKSWLDHELPAASDQDVTSFVKITTIGKDIIQSVEMSNAGISAPYIGRLAKLGVLNKISRGRYSLQKSPMIAVYEALKRGLQINQLYN